MRPAFSSTTQAAAFALLLLVILLSPVWAGKRLLPSREQSYESQGWGSGPYPWICHEVFEETNDIDIAFMGSSHMFNDINTPYVQEQLSRRLGRPAVVRTIAWGGAGYDALYLIARDLLAHRRVRMLVIYDEDAGRRNAQIPMLFRWGDDAGQLSGLAMREQSLFYFAAIIGLPRNLLSDFIPNLPAPLITGQKNYWETVADAPNPVTRLGSLSFGKGFAPNPMAQAAPFVAFQPATAARARDVVVYAPSTAANFEFSTNLIPDWQEVFARKLGELFRAQKVQPVMLHLPVLAEARAPVLRERADWSAIFGGDFKLMGIRPVILFGGVSDSDLLKLYGDPVHFSRNGQEYFTPLITPSLLELYEESSNH
jgi:hypothetical protein